MASQYPCTVLFPKSIKNTDDSLKYWTHYKLNGLINHSFAIFPKITREDVVIFEKEGVPREPVFLNKKKLWEEGTPT
jgi:hypothetical protein